LELKIIGHSSFVFGVQIGIQVDPRSFWIVQNKQKKERKIWRLKVDNLMHFVSRIFFFRQALSLHTFSLLLSCPLNSKRYFRPSHGTLIAMGKIILKRKKI
jgi:hypothetical protein